LANPETSSYGLRLILYATKKSVAAADKVQYANELEQSKMGQRQPQWSSPWRKPVEEDSTR